MAVRLSDISSKTGKKFIFCVFRTFEMRAVGVAEMVEEVVEEIKEILEANYNSVILKFLSYIPAL